MNEIELNTQNKTLNETEKDLQILLKDAGVDEIGEIRFDKEKYFSDCYGFKVKLDEKEVYFSTPLQNAKRIFNNYINSISFNNAKIQNNIIFKGKKLA